MSDATGVVTRQELAKISLHAVVVLHSVDGAAEEGLHHPLRVGAMDLKRRYIGLFELDLHADGTVPAKVEVLPIYDTQKRRPRS